MPVAHLRTGEAGVIIDVAGPVTRRMCTVQFEHGTQSVPQALLRPLDDAFDVIATPASHEIYPYDGWLRRERFRLLDALRNDRALGLSNSRVEPQLHQVSVALRALEKPQPRLILADEVGLGKTIEAGLVLKEMRARMGADLERVLVIVPASLVTQWRYEMRSKFNERFVVHDSSKLSELRDSHPDENPWSIEPNVIATLQFARAVANRALIASTNWDLVIVDEAHHARRVIR